ncbi:diguanylate cyclase [Chlamydiota bacterium]
MKTIYIPKVPDKENNGKKRAYFILIYGEPLGEIFEIDKKESIVGREDKATFNIEDSGISREHAKIIYSKDKVILKDLGSKNGTYVNNIKIDEIELKNDDRISIGRTCLKFSFTDTVEKEFYKDFFKLATRDGLTNAVNKTYMTELFDRDLSRAKRYNRPLSVMMLDIDLFKNINDSFGHLAGDYVLREISKVISDCLRKEDIFARFGGEEFFIVFPDLNLKKAKIVAEKIRQNIEGKRIIFNNDRLKVTVSIGLAEYSKNKNTAETLIRIADENLYIAKGQGRNRICDD